jgi:hypothetical protein
MHISESGQCRATLELKDYFTAQNARDFLSFIKTCGYADSLKLLVLTGQSRSKLSHAEAAAFGAEIAELLSGGSGRIAVVYEPEPKNRELEYVVIDTTISLTHRMIAQFTDVSEAKSWLGWDGVTSDPPTSTP